MCMYFLEDVIRNVSHNKTGLMLEIDRFSAVYEEALKSNLFVYKGGLVGSGVNMYKKQLTRN